VDSCTQWYVAKRTGLLIFWIVGSILFGGFAFYFNWILGAVWCVFAVLGFVAFEKMLMRRVDPAAPR
jgi:predicted outer membrane lipoprotein